MKKSIAALIAASALSFAPVSALAKDNAPKKKLAPAIHKCVKDDSTINALSCNIILEAGGEGTQGMMAVGFVTLNRKMKQGKFPSTVSRVIYQDSQFSWTSGKNLTIRDEKAWKQAREISKNLILLQKFPAVYHMVDPTQGALYYHKATVHPYWSKYFLRTVRIKNHVFYKERSDG
ncbi:putative cell wall hydrolase [Pectobacterium phage DU_PP_I]|nr:putative cell wall hydrolase [Pectobacterium phage DU_PP_I]ATS93800.1 putative cell wall hydrolase [Pectobacterium phage DU_PP_IV]